MLRSPFFGVVLACSAFGCGCQASGAGTARFQPPTPTQLFPDAAVARAQAPELEPPRLVKPAGFNAESKPDVGLPREIDTVGIKTAKVVARVNGEPILLLELQNAAAGRLIQLSQQVPAAQWRQVEEQILKEQLEDLINREVLIQDAENRVHPKQLEKVYEMADKEFEKDFRTRRFAAGFKSDEEMLAKLEKEGQSLTEIKRQRRREFMALEYLKNLIADKINSITREDTLDYYRKNPQQFEKKESVTWQYIWIDKDYNFKTQTEARIYAEKVHALVRNLRRDEDFEALAMQYSHQSNKNYTKGVGEGQVRGSIKPPEVEDLIFRLQPGQTGPLMEVPGGFHIVRVIDHQPGGKIPFDAVNIQIRDKLRNDIFQSEMKRIVAELRSKATVEVLMFR